MFFDIFLFSSQIDLDMPCSDAQIRQLLIEEEGLLTENEVAAQPLQRGSEAGSSSRNSQKSRRAAQHPTPPSKAEAEVDTTVFTVLRAAYRKLPVFDDARPDPGAGAEQLNYLQTVDPVFAPASRDKKVGKQHQRLL